MSFSILRKTVRATGGTETDEFAAKIKSVTSSTTVGAVFVYDTRNDSDGGAWRKKCAGLSWYDETLNTATRGGRREFPSVALIVADGGSTDTLSIYDLDDVSAPLWMVFEQNTNDACQNSGYDATSVFALNGQILVGFGTNGGLRSFNFADDSATSYRHAAGTTGKYLGNLAERNDAKSFAGTSESLIVNSAVNDVAATIVEGAEIGALGLPKVTIGVATDGGVSVIHPNGDVYDVKGGSAVYNVSESVDFTDDGKLMYSHGAGPGDMIFIDRVNIPYADETWEDTAAIADGKKLVGGGAMSAWGTPIPSVVEYPPADNTSIFSTMNRDKFAVGNASGLTVANVSTNNPRDGMVAYITSTYNTGYMLGDIRFAGLANVLLNDRSVKANTLTQNGSITSALVATDAELKAYSNWSASNYVSRANDTDFDFGTGNFSIMFWCKSSTTGSTNDFIARGDVTPEAGDFFIRKNASEKIQLFRHTGTSYQSPISASSSSIGTSWSQVVVTRSGTTVSIYVNGKREVSETWSDTFTPSGGSAFTIGLRLSDTSVTGQHMSLSLVRISATAPTPTQVADIYREEAKLFRSGAKCLLQSDDASPNAVNDLSYDASTDLLHVFQNGDTVGENLFRGLEVVESRGRKSDGWTYSSASYGAAAGGVSASARALSGGGVIVDLPPFDVRGDTNIADSKSSNDGKIRFTAVTTDATPTVIGNIPVAENEAVNVIARIEGVRYDLRSSSWNIFGEIKQQFYRNLGGDVAARSEATKLINEGTSSLDFDLDISTSAQTVQVEVTGSSAVRMQFKATVEVQRISEKQYER